MKLLILTQYFPPEVGAPQNRLFELAVRLLKAGVEVTVLTAMPNYPKMEVYPEYRGKKFLHENMEGISVYRSRIFVSKSKSILNRLRNYFSFVISSALASRKIKGDFDFLLCESPPLFLGYSAMYIAKRKKAGLIFNVSDLWPESAEKLGVVTNKLLLKLAYNLEKKLYLRSVLVTGQTQGICKDIGKRFLTVPTYWLPNGVDLGYYDPSKTKSTGWRSKLGFSPTDFVLMYAGIIGIAQGLEIILKAAQRFKTQPHVKFVLMGNGPEKEKLLQLKTELQLNNLFFLDAVSKKEMPGILKEVDVALVPLRKLELFLGAIPSKVFENLAMEVPVLLGVDGEAKDLFITKGKAGLFVEPENVEALIAGIHTLEQDRALTKELGENGRRFVMENFNREQIASQFYTQLTKLLPVSKTVSK
ncbi:MAG: glycosyltransferase family 4 protein [bacterium]|nr:glycosyltransferase family 4 protein [bacterium]